MALRFGTARASLGATCRGVPQGPALFAGVAQWLEFQPSKLAMRVRFPSPAPPSPAPVATVNPPVTSASVNSQLPGEPVARRRVRLRFMLDVVAPVGG